MWLVFKSIKETSRQLPQWQAPWNLLQYLQRQPRILQITAFLGLFILVAWLDLIIDPDLSLFSLYLIPTICAAWFLGIHWGYGSCLASAAVWVFDDWREAAFYHHTLIPYWNIAGRSLVLMLIVALVIALKSAMEDEFDAERRGVQREFEIASEVQSHLLPSQTPDYPNLDFGFVYLPAREVGGDYYDFIPFNPDRLGLAVGDVSGKGLFSALLMASLQGLVRMNLEVRKGEMSRFMAQLNQSMYKLTSNNRYATLFFAVMDVSAGTLHYVNAGHNPPLLVRKSENEPGAPLVVTRLENGGPPVGLLPKSQYQSEVVPLHKADILVAFTDGVIEALNPQQEEFGEERLIEIVRSAMAGSAAEICERIAERLKKFVAGSTQRDDITLVVMKIDEDRSP